MIRYAIWAAVSTREQAADDKASLDNQVEACRKLAAQKGWQETAGPFIVPGESRTRWVELGDAERAIPQLRQLLDEAQDKRYDVLLVHEYDRFRELLDPVARTLNHYGIQLVSVSQFSEPQPPELFNVYANDSEYILRGINAITSRMAISSMRRKYLSSMPKRITERGLGQRIPWGYRKPQGREMDSGAIPEQDPEIIKHLIMMKNMLLGGRSTHQIAAELDRLDVPLSRGKGHWRATTVARILMNPYYAGFVRWGVSKTSLDLRQGSMKRTWRDKSQVITAQGKHEPVWDEATLHAIEAEFGRRGTGHRGHITRQLSGLLQCSICGATLWRNNRNIHRTAAERVIIWRCSGSQAAHMIHRNDVLLERVAVALDRFLDEQQAEPVLPSPDQQLAELRERRRRVGDAYEAGAFDLSEFSRRVSDIDATISKLESRQLVEHAIAADAAMRRQLVEQLREIRKQLPLIEYLKNGDKQEVNAALRQLIDRIVVDPAGNIIEVRPHKTAFL